MLWIFAGPVLLFLLAVPFLLPHRSLRLALGNTRRTDGSRSRSRLRREARHAARFLGPALGLPLLALVLLEVGLFSFHRHAVPSTTLNELFGDYFPETSLHAPDLEAWNEAIAEAEAHAADARRERRHRSRRHPLARALLEHFPLHLVFVIGPSALLVEFLRRTYPRRRGPTTPASGDGTTATGCERRCADACRGAELGSTDPGRGGGTDPGRGPHLVVPASGCYLQARLSSRPHPPRSPTRAALVSLRLPRP